MTSALEWGLLPWQPNATGVIPADSRESAEQAEARGERGDGLACSAVCRLRDDTWPPGREWWDGEHAVLLERIADLTGYNTQLLDKLGAWEGKLG